MNVWAASEDFRRTETVIDSVTRTEVPSSWLVPLGALKVAGAVGLVVGLVVGIVVPLIGVAAAVGLILFFVCAVSPTCACTGIRLIRTRSRSCCSRSSHWRCCSSPPMTSWTSARVCETTGALVGRRRSWMWSIVIPRRCGSRPLRRRAGTARATRQHHRVQRTVHDHQHVGAGPRERHPVACQGDTGRVVTPSGKITASEHRWSYW